jgi:predicted nuclease of predicted toxin-antitoxin system
MVAERIRFHLDEHMDPDIAAALRRHGVDVTTSVEAGLRTASDHRQFSFADLQRRVIVTDDADFLRLTAINAAHPGIVICHRQFLSIREIIRGLILVYEVLTPEEMVGRVEFV